MLTLACESTDPSSPDPSRTALIERLFAEALTQVGRTAEARPWWIYLVDNRGANDFATLLRCAETETFSGKNTALAAKRIAAARAAADSDPFRLALIKLLEAELAIRQIKFDTARARLADVVRSEQTDTVLRARAQWLIGETHYLQQHFAEAIEAYRQVERFDSNGMWVAAALVQAGKAFEQLGRTREAAMCYGGLLDRFADSPHVATARRRLAAISPESNSRDHSSNQTLRR